MDCMELHEFLQKEYLENPLVECDDTRTPAAEEPAQTERARNEQFYEEPSYAERSYDASGDEEPRSREIPAPRIADIRDEILEQLPQGACSWELVSYMIDCLDDSGFFTMPIEEVARETGTSTDEVAWTLRILQELEPYGIFAPDLRHCLLRQLEMMDLKGTPVYRIVDTHLQDVADGKVSAISRGLHLPTVEVRKCIEQIMHLKPRPISQFGTERNDYVIPDILLRKEDGGWEIELNDHWVENYHISDYYLRMMNEAQDEELSAYFRGKLERIRFVRGCIAQRRQTIRQIAEVILDLQQPFLNGNGFLRPMTMSEVADRIGVHTSTVSRATKGKYIQYPGGTILMKNLFTATVSTVGGDDAVGVMQIKEQIKELIRNEDKSRPYSDQRLMELLRERDIVISRRAVAKYREELGIRGSYDRRQFDHTGTV